MPDELTSTPVSAPESPTPALSSAPAAAPVQQSAPDAAQVQQTEAQQPTESLSAGTSEPALQQGDTFAETLRTELQTFMGKETEQNPEDQQQREQQQQQQQQQQPESEEKMEGCHKAEEGYESPWFRDTDGREVIPAVYVDELQREVTVEELVEKFKGYDYYHQNALKAQEDVRRINEANQQLAAKRQEIQQKMDELNSAKNDPTLKILQMLRGDEELKRDFTELVRRKRPNGFRNAMGKTRAEQQRAEFEAMQNRLSQLEAESQQRAAAVQQQQKMQQNIAVKNQIEAHVNARVKELADMGINVSNEDLKAIADTYLPLLNTQGFNFQSVASHFDNYFRLLANKGQQFISNYQSTKKAVAPAPPSGGAAPVVTPTPIRGTDDFEKTFAARFSQLVSGL